MYHYNHYTTLERSQIESIDSPYLMNGTQRSFSGFKYFDASVMQPSTLVSYNGLGTFTTGPLPASKTPLKSLTSSAFFTPSTNSRCPTHGSIWPENIGRDQYVSTQIPGWGYEDTSSASDDLASSRVSMFESPWRKADNSRYGLSPQTASVEEDSEAFDPCYAELLQQCLLEAPNHTASLRDIYGWIAEHSLKASDPTSSGWKNSVRHNLSMNKGFEKCANSDRASDQVRKSRSYWTLTDEAVLRGIQSTNRHRKRHSKRNTRRSNKNSTPNDRRVKSGAKGGHATRRLATRRGPAATCSILGPLCQQTNHRDASYPIRPSTAAVPAFLPSPVTSFPIPTSSVFWPAIVDIQDSAPYAASDLCNLDNKMHKLYPTVSSNFPFQPFLADFAYDPQYEQDRLDCRGTEWGGFGLGSLIGDHTELSK